MAVSSKPDPSTTFLTGVSRESRGSERSDSPDTVKSAEQSKAEVGRALILTLLSQSSTPINRKDLAARAELSPDWYDEVVSALKNDLLIEEFNSELALTERGWEAAKRARERLLTPF